MLELAIACMLFLGVLGIVFFFFRYGTRAFMTANQRQGVQADALRVMDGLQADLKRTAGKSVLILNNSARTRTIETATVHRDAISLISLKDWSDPNNTENFDLAGSQPKWNRYWIYYASNDQDRGALIRLKVDPLPPPISPIPLTILKFANLCRDNPSFNNFDGSVPAHSYLCRNVYEFKVDRDGNNSFRLSLKLQEKRQLRPDGGIVQGMETYQLQMFVRPENTYPQDLTNI
ncbi:MAG: hypothetical protein KF760_31965 [Candidatus Eremiobacteraeota bacterium]|nr:hypothetical protein [Candidatus Eremiobacteraeota bacterium]MCW5871471.1 hypothetical protein [Candidatus Eremiobacteraeota bacterium]